MPDGYLLTYIKKKYRKAFNALDRVELARFKEKVQGYMERELVKRQRK